LLKVYRIISIEHADTGRHIATRDGLCLAKEALEGLPDGDAIMVKLMRGEPHKFDQRFAGMRIHGRITPAHAINRQGMERRKREKTS
jgi:hypothetical protein